MAQIRIPELGAHLFALGLALAPTPGAAQSACTLPVQPVCSTGVMGSDTASGKLRCESDITKYIQDLETYRGCLDGANAKAQQQVELAKQFRDCLNEGRENCSFAERR